MTTEIEKKKTSWFKNAMAQPVEKATELPDIQLPEEQPVMLDQIEQIPVVEEQEVQGVFTRENQDKIALDVISAMENLLKDRQFVSLKNQALNEQISTANETIQRIKRESLKKDQLIQDKNKEIRELETNLTNNQMSYDQLLEDYKEYQLNANLDFEKISNQLETEKAKYEKLYEESSRINAQHANTITELQERIRNLEIENIKYVEQYEKISNEKAELMKSINDFTEKMSFSFNFKAKEN